MKHDIAVVPMRGQVFTSGHEHLIYNCFDNLSDTVIIALGSINVARSLDNPFTFNERREMVVEWFKNSKYTLQQSYKDRKNGHIIIGNKRLFIIGINDHLDDKDWQNELYTKIKYIGEAYRFEMNFDNMCLVGSKKGNDGELRNQWKGEFGHVENFEPLLVGGSDDGVGLPINATDIRHDFIMSNRRLYDLEQMYYDDLIPDSTYIWMQNWYNEDKKRTNKIKEEYIQCRLDKEKYGEGPHLTADSLLVYGEGHNAKFLLIERGGKVGNSLMAFPGGFLDEGETFLQCAKRELKEELSIDNLGEPSDMILLDNPKRDPRGRVISMLYIYQLSKHDYNNLNPVAGDDATKYEWLNITDLMMMDCPYVFSDHIQAISKYINR